MAISITNTDSHAFTDYASTPQSFTASFGAAVSDRQIYAEIYGVLDASISSVTIGGVAATFVAGASGSTPPLGEQDVYWASVPSGTSGTVSIAFSGTPSDSSLTIFIYRVTGADATTPVSASGIDTSGGASLTITVPTGGVLLALSSAIRVGSTPSFLGWSGTGVSTDASLSNANQVSADMLSETAIGTTSGSITVSASWASGTSAQVILSAIAIQPSTGPAPVSLLGRAQSKSTGVAVTRVAAAFNGRAKAASLARATMSLRQPVAAMSKAASAAFGTARIGAGLRGTAKAAATGRADRTLGAASLSGQSAAMSEARAQPSGAVPLAGASKAISTGSGMIVFVAVLRSISKAMSSARSSLPIVKAAFSGRSTSESAAKAGVAFTQNLSATGKAVSKASGGAVFGLALAAVSAGQAKARGAVKVALALGGRAVSQATGMAILIKGVSLAAISTARSTARLQAPGTIFLIGLSQAIASAGARMSGALTLTARSKATSTGMAARTLAVAFRALSDARSTARAGVLGAMSLSASSAAQSKALGRATVRLVFEGQAAAKSFGRATVRAGGTFIGILGKSGAMSFARATLGIFHNFGQPSPRVVLPAGESRIVVPDGYSRIVIVTLNTQERLQWPSKLPGDDIDNDVIWSRQLAAPPATPGDIILSSAWNQISGDCVPGITAISTDGQRTKLWLSGGTVGVVSEFENTVVTQQGRTFNRIVFIYVVDGTGSPDEE